MEAVAEFMPLLRDALLDLANKACSDQSKVTAPQLKELLKLALVSARQTKRFAPDTVSGIWQPEAWSTLKQHLAQSSRFSSSTGLHKMCSQMVQLTGQSQDKGENKKSPTKRKRKADAEPEAKGKVKAKKAKAS